MGILDEASIPYMVVGSYAASFHGLSRATHDLDLVVALSSDSLHNLLGLLGDRFYWSEESAKCAVLQADMFNAIHHDSGLKVDFWVLADDDFARTQFSRREPSDFRGVGCWVASAEDTILSKLRWYKMSASERQLSDARAIFAVGGERLDTRYIRDWAERLGLLDVLRTAEHGP